jgi:hypothetical protein
MISIAFWLICILSMVSAQAEQAPYLYYYSHALNGIVIERADGTDSRVIGQGVITNPKIVNWGSVGVSPDKNWLTLQTEVENLHQFSGDGQGLAVALDGQTRLKQLDEMRCIFSMQWSPDSRYLLVYGVAEEVPQHDCGYWTNTVVTYWLFDVTQQTIVAAHYAQPEFGNVAGANFAPAVVWDLEQGAVSFPIYGLRVDWERNYCVTMQSDGIVTQMPRDCFDGQIPDSPPPMFTGEDTSPSGRYAIDLYQLVLTDTASGTIQSIPIHSSATEGYLITTHWDTAETWVLLAYERCAAGCGLVPGANSVFNAQTGQYRDLTNCGENCAHWLPDDFNPEQFSVGRDHSVLLAPDHWQAQEKYNFWLSLDGTHQLRCNTSLKMRTLVYEKASEEIVFELPKGDLCYHPFKYIPDFMPRDLYDVEYAANTVFAFSPDERYYALADNDYFTELFDAQTGERLATLNIQGTELWFSDDSRTLYTRSRFAVAEWDVAEVLAHAEVIQTTREQPNE